MLLSFIGKLEPCERERLLAVIASKFCGCGAKLEKGFCHACAERTD